MAKTVTKKKVKKIPVVVSSDDSDDSDSSDSDPDVYVAPAKTVKRQYNF